MMEVNEEVIGGSYKRKLKKTTLTPHLTSIVTSILTPDSIIFD